MAKKKVTFEIEVGYDDKKTNPESLGDALDIMLDTARETPGILDDHGDVHFYGFFPKKGSVK